MHGIFKLRKSRVFRNSFDWCGSDRSNGTDNLYKLDPNTLRWEIIGSNVLSGQLPSSRALAGFTLAGDKFYMFGGLTSTLGQFAVRDFAVYSIYLASVGLQLKLYSTQQYSWQNPVV